MTIWAIVPVKPLNRAKSRLAPVLTREQRARLSRRLLVNTLDVLAKVPAIEHTLVVSRDSSALALARKHGARTVTERGKPRLDRALIRATLVAQGYGVSAVLVLPADLPLITAEAIEDFIAHAKEAPIVVLAPDHHGTGTNALLSAPPGLIEYEFGPDSFHRHLARAQESGVRVEVCSLPSVALDLDNPEDLEQLGAEWREAIVNSTERE